jgi:hypothetical protein
MAVLSQMAAHLPQARNPEGQGGTPDRSAYYAFVDRDYIFTVEVVGPGTLLLNFVSMADETRPLTAKQVRIRLESRTVPVTSFLVETGDAKQPLVMASLSIRPRSSFGVRLQGEFGDVREVFGATVRLGEEEFRLAPLSSLAFENLVLKVNRINLGSPDFRDDWRVLKLEVMGTRGPAPRKGSTGRPAGPRRLFRQDGSVPA